MALDRALRNKEPGRISAFVKCSPSATSTSSSLLVTPHSANRSAISRHDRANLNLPGAPGERADQAASGSAY